MGNEEKQSLIRAKEEYKQKQFETERFRFLEEESKRKKEEEERKRRERNKNDIDILRNVQNIALFLELIERFSKDYEFLIKTLEAINESIIIKKYEDFKKNSQGKIEIIKKAIYEDNELSKNCLRKLVIILLCYEKNEKNCDQIVENMVKKGDEKKKLLFNVLLDYSNEFGTDIFFKDVNIYKEFVEFSLPGNYLESLNYRSNDIIQLELLFENKEKIYDSKNEVKFNKLNDYSTAYELIEKIIKYEKEKGRKFVLFPKVFWDQYYIYYINNENEDKRIGKLVDLYKLLLSYIDLGEDDTEYKDILSENIHDIIIEKLDNIKSAKEQLELLFKNDPYYAYPCDKRDPNIFEKINIFDLKEEQDIKYFQEIDIEKVYGNNFKDFLTVIIKKINKLENFNSIIKIIELKKEKNIDEYINLMIKRYSKFNEEELTEESFINFLRKVKEYSPKNIYLIEELKDNNIPVPDIAEQKLLPSKAEKVNNFLEEFLPKFQQKYTIYLQILEEFEEKEDDLKNIKDNIKNKYDIEEKEGIKIKSIREQVANLSIENLELSYIIELIKGFKKKEQKKAYFENISMRVISYDDFFEFEPSDNLKLLMELIKNKLIPESTYLDKNKAVLDTIYEKLANYNEKRSKYLEIINNEKDEIQKIYSTRFELFKIKDDKFDSKSEFNKIKDRYLQVKQDIEKAYQISLLLSLYYKDTYKEDIDKINNIYKDYSNKENKVNLWINKEKEIKEFNSKFDDKAKLIEVIKDIKLFQIIYNHFCKGNEISKFDKAKELLDESKVIFEDIQKGNPVILGKWKNKFKKEKGIEEELIKLKEYYKIDNNEDLDKVTKKILIFTKKNMYYSDIKYLLYFIKLFKAEETDLTKYLKEKKSEFEEKENLDFENLVNIKNYLENKEIYINDGKDDSPSIKLIRLLYDKEDEINYLKTKDADSVATLLYKLNPTKNNLEYNDILEYQNCISFINNIKEKKTDEELLNLLKEEIEKDDINKILGIFTNYFMNYGNINSLESNFDISKDIYGNIKAILNNSKFKIKIFKREFIVYDNNKKEKDIIVKDFDGLQQLKDNVNLNFELLPNIDNKLKEELMMKHQNLKSILKEKREKIEIFIKYVEQLQNIIKYFKNLENKGCPFLIDILVTSSKDKITFELVDEPLKYDELIFKLKQFYNDIVEYQSKFYKENEYFRYVYDKQLYRLYKRIGHKNKDISSYVRFFTNGNSIIDDFPFYEHQFNNQIQAFKNYKVAFEENFELISKYIKNIFTINETSLEILYKNIKVKDNFKGIYKCNVSKYNMDLFIIKIFLELTGTFPIAQNVLLANSETSSGEIYSFMHRAIKCRFSSLFVISINDDFSVKNLNLMISLMNKIIGDMKKENIIKEIKDLESCIIFITQINKLGSSRRIDSNEVINLPDYLTKNEDKLGYNINSNEIYNRVKIYSSDCCGLGKSYKIKEDIIERGEDYHYFGIGDDISKDELFKKLKKFLKHEIKGKFNIGIHLDLFYTKNISLMNYFLFAMLITKFFQTNNYILYIPKNINIYIEIPNGPQQFLDDYPILTIFKRINISLDNQIPLEISNENLPKEVNNLDKKNIMTYIEKRNYLNIINYLSLNKKEDIKNYDEKIKIVASRISKCIYSKKLKEKDVSQKNKTDKERNDYIFEFFDFGEEDALKIQSDAPLIFNTKDGYLEIDISNKEINGKNTNYFLSNLKKVMSLDESVEEIESMLGHYKITEDNYKRMILILFRIFANIPVILMGETGCGKTELIKQLMKLLNKDKENNNFIIKNMHSCRKEDEIIEVIEKAEKSLEESKNDIVCVFFDDINTISFLSKMKEIFTNHSLNGEEIDKRIRFIGACNPFRKNRDNEGEEVLKLENIMAYIVNPLPNSLNNYILYFKTLDDHSIIKYIESIIGEEFPNGENDNSENSILRKIAIEAIYYSHKYVREKNGISSISLRDLQRFKKTYKFFNEYYKIKNEFLNNMDEITDKIDIKSKVQSFILSLFINYYIKIFKSGYNNEYLQKINDFIRRLTKYFKIKEWLDNLVWRQEPFNYIIRKEEDFLLEEMELKNINGIGLNNSLKENIFLMFFSIYAQIPLIVVGKPGCSKSLSIQLIIKIMRGKFSNSNFLKKYPKINITAFQGSETNTPESIENIFKEAKKKIDLSQSEKISLLVFDGLDLSGRSPTNCLKVLQSELEMCLDANEEKKISFIGISNCRLGPSIMNRAIFLAKPEIKMDDVILTVEAIAKSYDEDLYANYKAQYKLLGNTYFNYKEKLKKEFGEEQSKKINDEFILNYHSDRDLYNIIKIFSSEMVKYNMPKDPNIIDLSVKRALAKNLSGLEINGESSLKKLVNNINFDDLR